MTLPTIDTVIANRQKPDKPAQPDIFGILETKQIPYAICVGSGKFHTADYFVIIHVADKNKVPKNGFTASDTRFKVVERDMTPDDIRTFRQNRSKYRQVVSHNGSVYEQQSNSFKRYYENLKTGK